MYNIYSVIRGLLDRVDDFRASHKLFNSERIQCRPHEYDMVGHARFFKNGL